MNWLIVAVVGLAAVVVTFMVTRGTVPGMAALDAQGKVAHDKAPSPDSQDDAMGTAIGKAVEAAFLFASTWKKK